MATEAQKHRFLKRVYFGVSDNPKDDFNPFQDLPEFGEAAVSEMRWGENSEVRQRSKLIFSFNYHNVLNHFSVDLKIEDIFSNLKDELTNDEVVQIWVALANFN